MLAKVNKKKDKQSKEDREKLKILQSAKFFSDAATKNLDAVNNLSEKVGVEPQVESATNKSPWNKTTETELGK